MKNFLSRIVRKLFSKFLRSGAGKWLIKFLNIKVIIEIRGKIVSQKLVTEDDLDYITSVLEESMASKLLTVTGVKFREKRKIADIVLNEALTIKGFKIKKTKKGNKIIFPNNSIILKRVYVKENIEHSILESYRALGEQND